MMANPERLEYYDAPGRAAIIGDWIWTSDGHHGVPITDEAQRNARRRSIRRQQVVVGLETPHPGSSPVLHPRSPRDRRIYRVAKRYPERLEYYDAPGRAAIIGDWIWTSDGLETPHPGSSPVLHPRSPRDLARHSAQKPAHSPPRGHLLSSDTSPTSITLRFVVSTELPSDTLSALNTTMPWQLGRYDEAQRNARRRSIRRQQVVVGLETPHPGILEASWRRMCRFLSGVSRKIPWRTRMQNR
jgi:hypothetical protein